MRVRAVLMDAVQAPMKGMTGALPPQETTGKVAVRKRPLPPELLGCLDTDFLLSRIERGKLGCLQMTNAKRAEIRPERRYTHDLTSI